MCVELPCTKGGCCFYTYFHMIYDAVFVSFFVWIQYTIARDWIYWDNARHKYHSFITLDYIFVYLSFRFAAFNLKDLLYESRGGVWLCSFFAGILGIWGLVKYIKYGASAKLNLLIIILIILSLILLLVFIFLSVFWLCFDKSDKDAEKQKLRDGVMSDQFRRYGDAPKANKIPSSPTKTDDIL
ncbi:unnamed protein product [Moneuplotes crassus]|uniref:Uncharacterized protein n=1 Tax=Euplotes crassus TaxID=5936 RepID=A0AAD2D6N0_EUPCR|nr:unnamed protein product [Moneuplotes crassus]